jgi:hypothetical protein
VEAGELGEAVEHVGEVVLPDEESLVVPRPGERPFDLPAVAVTAELAAVLRRRPFAMRAMRTNQFDSLLDQSLPQGIGVGRLVVDQPRRTLRQAAGFQQRFDQADFAGRRAVEIDSQRQAALPSASNISLRPLPRLVFPTAKPPF